MLDTKVVSSIGMLHIGVVFLVFGVFLLGAGLLPNDVSGVGTPGELPINSFSFTAINSHFYSIKINCFFHFRNGDSIKIAGKATSWWNELVATGLFAVILGIFLLVLNCLISKREEDDLEEYVQRQLTRSRSGHRLERDLETGGLTTRHNRRMKQTLQTADELSQSKSNITPITSEVVTPTTPNGKDSMHSVNQN